MLAKRRMDHTAIEQDLGRVRNGVKGLQGLVKLVVVVGTEGCHPGLDFLPRGVLAVTFQRVGTSGTAPTCFRDMTNWSS